MAKKARTPTPAEVATPSSMGSPDAPEPTASPAPDPAAAKTPVQELVEGIKVRQALVAKNPEDFPAKNRPGLVIAQAEAREELVVAERQYAQYLKDAAFAGVILTASKDRLQEFLKVAQDVSQSLVIVACDALYERLAKAAEVGLSDSRMFGAGQIGLVIQEMAQVGRELFFSELASPRWTYDSLVPTREDLKEVIRRAIRSSADGDYLNRSYLRMAAYTRALELGHYKSLVPVLITGGTPSEVEFLQNGVFNAAVTLDLDAIQGPITEDDVTAFFRSMVSAMRASDARRQAGMASGMVQ